MMDGKVEKAGPASGEERHGRELCTGIPGTGSDHVGPGMDAHVRACDS
jgi:hypothetical protein